MEVRAHWCVIRHLTLVETIGTVVSAMKKTRKICRDHEGGGGDLVQPSVNYNLAINDDSKEL